MAGYFTFASITLADDWDDDEYEDDFPVDIPSPLDFIRGIPPVSDVVEHIQIPREFLVRAPLGHA